MIDLGIILLALGTIWVASGTLLSAVQSAIIRLRFPSFSFSVLFLGFLTSIPEFSVATNALLLGKPEISLSNLIGGQVILLLFVIPLLAIAKRGLHLHYPLQPRTLAVTVFTNALPLIALLNGLVTKREALLMIALFLFFTAIFVTDLEQEHIVKRPNKKKTSVPPYIVLGKVVLCAIVIFFASNRLVASTIHLAQMVSLPSFFVSLLVLSIGTNVPEIILALRAVFAKKSTIALGDYIGSATVNTLIAGLLVLASGRVRITTPILPLSIPLIGFLLFWIFARSKRTVSTSEAVILVMVCLAFFLSSAWVEVGI